VSTSTVYNADDRSKRQAAIASWISGLASADVFEWLHQKWNSISRQTQIVFWVSVLANIIAYGFIFSNLTLNHDGFGAISAGGSVHRSTGRWMADIIYIQMFGSHEVIWLYNLIGMVLFILTGLSICRTLSVTDVPTRLAVVMCYTLFPYVCNYYAYTFFVPLYGVAAFAAVLAIELGRRHGILFKSGGILLLTLSFATYQAFVATALTSVCLLAAVTVAQQDRFADMVRSIRREIIPQLLAIGGASILYALSVRVSTTWFGVSLNEYQGANSMFSLDLESLTHGIAAALRGTLNFLGQDDPRFNVGYENPFFTGTSKVICAVLGAVAAYNLFKRSSAMLCGIVSVGFLAAALIAPRGVQILHPTAKYHELALGAYALYLAGVFAIALRCNAGPLRVAVQVAVLLVTASFIQSNNVAAMSLVLDYQATLHWANRVLTRVESHPGYGDLKFPAQKRFIFVGDGYQISQWQYRGRPYLSSVGIADGIPGIVFGSLFQLLRVNATVWGAGPENLKEARQYAATHKAWPADESITVLKDGTIVVVLDNSAVLNEVPAK